MAEAPFLHIRSPDSGQPPRVLQLDRPSVRVGLGPRCDVLLADPSLAEVHCILRRRGDDWTIQPIGPAGLMTLDGRAVETILRFPPGATLRIGRFTLRLVDPRPAARFGTYATPPIAAPDPDLPVEGVPRPGRIQPHPSPRPLPTTPASPLPPVSSERERLERWQNRQAPRPDLSRREEWTARWERAGREIRSRAVIHPPTTPRPAVPNPPAPAPTPVLAPIPVALPVPVPIPVPEARITPPAEPPKAPVVATAPVRLALPSPSPVVATDVQARDSAAVTLPDVEPTPERADTAVPAEVPPPLVEIPDDSEPASEPIADSSRPGYLVSSDFELESATWRDLTRHHDTTPETPETPETEAEPESRPEPEPESPPTVVLAPAPEIEPTPAPPLEAEPEPEPELQPPPPLAALPRPEAPTNEPIRAASPRLTIAPPPATEIRAPLAGVSEWPSAKVILEQYRRDKPAAPSTPKRPSVAAPSRPLPQPTVEYAPRSFTIPGRLGVGLAATLVLCIGTGMLALSWSWSRDDRLAGMLANQFVRPDPPTRRVALPESPPSLSWWHSTSDHLYLHALAHALGTAGDTASSAEVHALLDAARSASPLQRQVRLARIDVGDPGVGLSRDAMALRQTGKRLLREGKFEAALRAYHAALQGAEQVDLASSRTPAFDDANDVRRFQLPGESLLAPILNDLATAEIPADLRSRWYDALPQRAVIGLALFRFHHARGETPAAEQAARIALDAEPPSRPAARALHDASQAEVLALQGRLEEAAEHYNTAITAIPEGTVRRTWALNLGELESRLEHDDQARAAWALARGDDPNDTVNLRLVEARRRRGHLEPPTLLVTPSSTPAPPDTEVQQAGFETQHAPSPR